MAPRAPLPAPVLEEVLTKSARRCALCFGLDGSLTRVDGQIAHIDRNASNASVGNLAYLCLDHHNEYDSTPSQTRRFVPGELLRYRDRLYVAIANNEHHRDDPVLTRVQIDPGILAHDRNVFAVGDQILREETLFLFLQEIQREFQFNTEPYHQVIEFTAHFAMESHKFLLDDIAAQSEQLCDAFALLVVDLDRGFIPAAGRLAIRKFVLGADAMIRLKSYIAAADLAYREYRRTVKRTLLV